MPRCTGYCCTELLTLAAAADAAQPELLDVDQLLDFDPEEAPVPTPAAPHAAPPSASKRLKKALKPGAGNKAKRSKAEAAAAADAEAVETPPAAKRAKTSRGVPRCCCRQCASSGQLQDICTEPTQGAIPTVGADAVRLLLQPTARRQRPAARRWRAGLPPRQPTR